MRWLLLPLLLLLVGATANPRCLLSDFYGISWISEPTLRHMQLSRWLTTNGDSCTSEQLVVLWNKLAEWAGVADSAELRGKVLYYYARAREREDKK
jgi:hypothetical protein